jgi:hypothetical protein
MAGSSQAERVVHAAMAAIAAREKSTMPAPNERDPRRVTAHLGVYKVEAEFPPKRADSVLTIDRDGALVLKASVVAEWHGERRHDRVEVTAVASEDWFRDFLSLAPGGMANSAGKSRRKGRPTPKAARGKALSGKMRRGRGSVRKGKAGPRAAKPKGNAKTRGRR